MRYGPHWIEAYWPQPEPEQQPRPMVLIGADGRRVYPRRDPIPDRYKFQSIGITATDQVEMVLRDNGDWMTSREVFHRVAANQGTVRQSLLRLTNRGILEIRGSGNQNACRQWRYRGTTGKTTPKEGE